MHTARTQISLAGRTSHFYVPYMPATLTVRLTGDTVCFGLGNGGANLRRRAGLDMKHSTRTAAMLSLLATAAGAQECKVKIAVAHWDGKALEIGLAPEPSKFWGREKAKRYPALCLDGTAPDYVIA
jgi:hypothetical protein